MFKKNKKPETDKKQDNQIEEKISHDFVTHNMPESRLFSGQTFSNQSNNSKKDPSISDKNDHRKTGLLIIGGGIILVIALLFFGYFYFIKPNVKQPIAPVKETDQTFTATSTEASSSIEEVATTTVEAVATSTPLISTSTEAIASSSDSIMPEETPIASTTVTVSKVDTDADGLTDDEERITGTDPNKADTDNDGYSDIAELESGYDPLVPGKKVASTSAMLPYKIDSRATVIYPSSWEPTKNDANNVVVFTDSDQAFIQIIYQDNTKKLSPNDWFNEQFTGLTPGEAINGQTMQGFFSKDGLAAYVFSRDLKKVYSFSCSPLAANTNSVVLFHLMVKTMVIK